MSCAMTGRVQWGVMHHAYPEELHRGPITEQEARDWIKEFDEMGGRPTAFYLVWRSVSSWQSDSHTPRTTEHSAEAREQRGVDHG